MWRVWWAYAAGAHADPILLDVFNNLFMNIAVQMGLQLQNAAYSVNIKERLDFSCALFDTEGSLIANGPHMPVHLGSMGESIKTVIRENVGSMHPGDVYVLNDPYHGGTHLPDVTVITPVYLNPAEPPTFYVGSRGHHADIGGTTPGSMPPFSTRIEKEGVQINNVKLVDKGVLREAEMLALLSGQAVRGAPQDSGRVRAIYPSRNPQQNLADLKARLPPTKRACRSCVGSSTSLGWRWCWLTWATFRTTPKNWCAARSPSFPTVSKTVGSRSNWTTARASRLCGAH